MLPCRSAESCLGEFSRARAHLEKQDALCPCTGHSRWRRCALEQLSLPTARGETGLRFHAVCAASSTEEFLYDAKLIKRCKFASSNSTSRVPVLQNHISFGGRMAGVLVEGRAQCHTREREREGVRETETEREVSLQRTWFSRDGSLPEHARTEFCLASL